MLAQKNEQTRRNLAEIKLAEAKQELSEIKDQVNEDVAETEKEIEELKGKLKAWGAVTTAALLIALGCVVYNFANFLF